MRTVVSSLCPPAWLFAAAVRMNDKRAQRANQFGILIDDSIRQMSRVAKEKEFQEAQQAERRRAAEPTQGACARARVTREMPPAAKSAGEARCARRNEECKENVVAVL